MHPSRTEVVPPARPFSKPLGLVAGAVLTIVAHTNGATINAASPALVNVASAIAQASDGDTVVVPAGTADWTSLLTITKGITLVGATAVTNAGTQNPTVNDLTIIRDDSPLNTIQSGLIQAKLSPSQSFRLTGFTFSHGSRTTANSIGVVHLASTGSSPHLNMRVDHCHFDHIYGRNIQTDGWVYGVADHNYIVAQGNGQSFYINCATYGGYTLGNGAWADFPWFGTNKFFFIEGNTIVGNGQYSTSGAMDAEYGGRWVARRNDLTNAHIGWHGTEGSNRGCRAVEVYNNSFHWASISMALQQNRSGTSLQHDNTWDVSGTDGSQSRISIYREMGAVTVDSAYGVAAGINIWDVNDTEGNGTYVAGHSPYLFASGTARAASTQSGQTATFADSTKNWASNQWVGYSVTQTNPSAASYKKGSFIISNTSTTITYFLYTSGDRGPTLLWAAVDTYEIHRVLTAMDQGGRGKGDLIGGSATSPINTVTGVPGWPHQVLEPAFSWNNLNTQTNTLWGFSPVTPTDIEGRDYYNLGAGSAANTTPSQVSSIYTASLNGVAYTGTYIYPHPLVSNVPAPPTNLRIAN
jgi:hypothetical protein